MSRRPSIQDAADTTDLTDELLSQSIKIMVIGKLKSGKSNLIGKAIQPDRSFRKHYRATIGFDFLVGRVPITASSYQTLHFWDISGNEGYGHMLSAYFKETKLFVFVIDLTNVRASLKLYFNDSRACHFGRGVSEYFGTSTAEEIRPQCIVVYTKSDVPDITIPTSTEQLEHRRQLAAGLGIHEDDIKGSFITSANDGTGIAEMIKGISKLFLPSLPSDSFVFDLSGGAELASVASTSTANTGAAASAHASSPSGNAASAGIFSRLFGGGSSGTTSAQSDAEKLGIEPSF